MEKLERKDLISLVNKWFDDIRLNKLEGDAFDEGEKRGIERCQKDLNDLMNRKEIQ